MQLKLKIKNILQKSRHVFVHYSGHCLYKNIPILFTIAGTIKCIVNRNISQNENLYYTWWFKKNI